MNAVARLRRAYFDCRYGQLHVHQAIPPGGGFDEAAALLCIPGRQGSARFFHALLGPMGADRSIYAPDLPGCGESDSAGADAGPDQYALALTDLLDSLRQREVDVLAHAEGVETAIAMEKLRPHSLLRRLACTAPSPRALESLRSLNLAFRELPLAVDSTNEMAATPNGAQITDLIEYFGTAKAV